MAIILGIDPGSRKTGFGLVQQEGGKLAFLAAGTLDVSAEGELPVRLGEIFSRLDAICTQWRPHEVSIEKVFMARNADSALKLGQARGAALTAVIRHQLPVFEYSARQVKQAVTGTGGAEKSQVGAMVMRLLALEKAPLVDAADALAIAICHAHLRTSLARLTHVTGMRAGRLQTQAMPPKPLVKYPR